MKSTHVHQDPKLRSKSASSKTVVQDCSIFIGALARLQKCVMTRNPDSARCLVADPHLLPTCKSHLPRLSSLLQKRSCQIQFPLFNNSFRTSELTKINKQRPRKFKLQNDQLATLRQTTCFELRVHVSPLHHSTSAHTGCKPWTKTIIQPIKVVSPGKRG